ncbi:GroES-like protein [Neolentinus lepideus HHB14362 ss-1]|uniref:GroES-like protein n=1 Tax=Neolentinus lepideus HHB14362 ss-1 TaxID=1314782 RepID=A0A165V7S0_9AGAM|nr:GroES-like protein [Neolentinus lepideus HHB14362 ss-1]
MSTFATPKFYRAAAVTAVGKLELIDVEWKEPQPGYVVLKVDACGICRSDEATVNQYVPISLPRIPGHEIAGTIVAVHSSEKEWKVGQKTGAGWHGSHCFECDSCKSGDFNTCDKEQINGVTMDGGYAKYATLRSECLVPQTVRRSGSDVDADSMRNMGANPGDIVAIQGIGGIGHLAIQYARAMGFKTIALSTSDSKRELASNWDLVESLAVGGTLLLLAVIPKDLSIPALPMVGKRLSIRGWPAGTPKDIEETVTFSKLANISTQMQKYPLEKVLEAYDSMITGTAKFKAVFIP